MNLPSLYRHLSFGCLGAMMVAVPLVIDPDAFDAFRLPKWLLFLALVAAALGLRIAAAIEEGRLPFRHSRSLPVWVVWAGWQLMAVGFSSSPSVSLRRWGAFLLVAGIALVLEEALREPCWRSYLLGLALASGFLVAAVSVSQYFLSFSFLEKLRAVRYFGKGIYTGSTLGNPAVLAGYTGVLLPLFLAAMLAPGTWWRRLFGFAGAAVTLVSLVMGQSRIALAGVGLLILLWGVWWTMQGNRKRLGMLTGLILLYGAGIGAYAWSNPHFLYKVRQLTRLEGGGGVTARLFFWQVGVSLCREHPLTGVGPERWMIHYYDEHLRLMREGRNRFQPDQDRSVREAHNDYLQTAAEQGAPGLVCLLWWLFLHLRAGWRGARRGPERLWALGALGGLVMGMVNALASFPFQVAPVVLLMLVCAGLAVALEEE